MTERSDLPAGYFALRHSAGAADARREVVRVEGPDAAGFLQGQLSQDVALLPDGASAWSWLLQPAGKVEALVRVTHVTGDNWLLDTDRGWGAAVAARLNRFRLRTKVDVEALADWSVLALRGPDAADIGAAVASGGGSGIVAVLDATWPELPGVDLVGPGPAAPPGVVTVEAGDWEAARIEAGFPLMGAELTERTIPAETGLVERTVSFTKGCYTGQELVARIDSRGSNVPRRLRGVRLDGPVEVGSALQAAGGGDVGTVTSVRHSPISGWVALAYVRRGVEVGTEVTAGAERHGSVEALPLVGAGPPPPGDGSPGGGAPPQ